MATSPVLEIPDHVPPELVVRDFPFSFGATTDQIPFDAMLSRVHDNPDIFYVPGLAAGNEGGWVLRRDEDLREVYKDYAHFSNRDTTPFPQFTGGDWRVLPLESDPPLHSAYRRFLNPVFSPKVTNALDGKIRQYARDYVHGFKDSGRIDFLQQFAFEFPIKVFLELMGLPQSRVKQFLDWTGELLHAPDLETLIRATNEVIDYLRSEIEDRKINPRDDVISHGVKARIDEEGRPLSEDELLGFCFNLFVGGLDTISTNLTWQFLHLARNPDQQELLRSNPAMIPDAIDEFMRAFAAVMTFRVCIKDTQIRGVTIKVGEKVALSTSIASRDPSVWDRPDEVILDRKPRHLSFGYGPHLCVGMYLARREMKIAMEEFLAAIPPFRLVPGVRMVTALHGVMQPDTLMLEWDVPA